MAGLSLAVVTPIRWCYVKIWDTWLVARSDCVQRPDGGYHARIEQIDLHPVRSHITLSSMGMNFEDVHYLDVRVRPDELHRMFFVKKAFEYHRLYHLRSVYGPVVAEYPIIPIRFQRGRLFNG